MIGVLYSCDLCGISDVEVRIEHRGPEEDILDWMEKLTLELGRDHARRSPGCRPEQLKRVKIPMPAGADYIGGPVKQ